MSFKDILNKSTSLEELVEASNKSSGKKDYSDDRFWTLKQDEDGNGSAEIRFLMAPKGEKLPWVQYWSYGFKGPRGQWYIEKCLSTLGKPDPVLEYNSKKWDDNDEDAKKDVRSRKRRLSYVSNIYVVNDPANPENNGKVFLFRYGAKLFEKIKDKLEPEFDDDDRFDPFHLLEGANFKLRIRKLNNFPNYDKSEFAAPSQLFDGDEDKLIEVYEKLYSLEDLISEDKFETFETLKVKFDRVMGIDQIEVPGFETVKEGEGDMAEALDSLKPLTDTDNADESDDDSDDPIAMFRKLAQESEEETE